MSLKNIAHINKKKKLEELHKKMIEEIQDYAIVLLDIDGTVLTWNKGVQEIHGYSESEIVGQNFEVFYTAVDQKEHLPQKLLELAMREGRTRHIGRRIKKDGTTFWASVSITALHDEDNYIVGFTKLTRPLRNNEMD